MEIEKIIVGGVQETVDNILEFGKEADRQLGLAMLKVVIRVNQTAKVNAPFRTGFLRQNIVHEVTLGRRSNIKGTVTSKAPYSAAQEFGTTRGIPATRFMLRAISSNVDFAERTLGQALQRATLRSRKK